MALKQGAKMWHCDALGGGTRRSACVGGWSFASRWCQVLVCVRACCVVSSSRHLGLNIPLASPTTVTGSANLNRPNHVRIH